MVLASSPVCSVMRLAARPVGAANATRTPLATSRRKIVSSRVVLPTPGPPVTTATLEPSTSFRASRCEVARVLPVRLSTQGMALSRSISGQGGGPDARSISRDAIACSDKMQALEEEAGLVTDGVRDDLAFGKLLDDGCADQGLHPLPATARPAG